MKVPGNLSVLRDPFVSVGLMPICASGLRLPRVKAQLALKLSLLQKMESFLPEMREGLSEFQASLLVTPAS